MAEWFKAHKFCVYLIRVSRVRIPPLLPSKRIRMKITIYGTSSAKFRKSDPSWGFKTYCEQISDYFQNYTINWKGVNTCSIERMYSLIKKDKNSDIIIIMHGKPDYIYCPGLVKDISIHDMKTMLVNKQNRNKGMINSHTRQTGKNISFILSLCYYYTSIFYDPNIRIDIYSSILMHLDKLLMNRKVVHCSCLGAHDLLNSGSVIKETKKIFKQSHPVYYFIEENHNKLAQLLIGKINEYNRI